VGMDDSGVVLQSDAEAGNREGWTIMAGNCMLPTSSLISKRSATECFGAKRDAASTVTVDHFGGEYGETKDASGVQ